MHPIFICIDNDGGSAKTIRKPGWEKWLLCPWVFNMFCGFQLRSVVLNPMMTISGFIRYILDDGSTVERTMASKYLETVHHEFRAGKSQQWWDTAQAGRWRPVAVGCKILFASTCLKRFLQSRFLSHRSSTVPGLLHLGSPRFAEQFQEFIDGRHRVNFGLGAWMNICREINVEIAGPLVRPPYRKKILMALSNTFCLTF